MMSAINLVVLLLALGGLYADILRKWAIFLASNDTYSYGLLVPLVAAYIAYLKISAAGWQKLKAEVQPQVGGYVLIGAACVLLAVSQSSAATFLARLSFLIAVVGVVLAVFGARILRRFAFPVGFLFFILPIPSLIYLPLSTRLQTLSSIMAGRGLDLLGVPALREGNIITLPTTQLEVVEACNGIHSLLSLIATSAFAGYLLLRGYGRRVMLILAAIPLAIVLNGVRITLLGLISYQISPAVAEGFAHFTTGAVVFAAGTLLIMVACRWLASNVVEVNGAATVAPSPRPRAVHARPGLVLNGVAAAVIVAFAVVIHYNVRPDEPKQLRQPFAAFPDEFAGWKGLDLPVSKLQLASLAADSVMMRQYSNPAIPVPVTIYTAYYATQQEGSSMHSPMHCIPGAGWQTLRKTTVRITTDGYAGTIRANKVLFAKEEDRTLVLYWYMEQGEAEPNEFRGALRTLWRAWSDHRSDGCLIRISAPIVSSEEDTLGYEQDFIKQALPVLLSSFLPPPSTREPQRQLARD